ncbi:MAG: hypothetical protein WCV81_01350 [Microgenomates group bacterium]|jgi:hypothetical protein
MKEFCKPEDIYTACRKSFGDHVKLAEILIDTFISSSDETTFLANREVQKVGNHKRYSHERVCATLKESLNMGCSVVLKHEDKHIELRVQSGLAGWEDQARPYALLQAGQLPNGYGKQVITLKGSIEPRDLLSPVGYWIVNMMREVTEAAHQHGIISLEAPKYDADYWRKELGGNNLKS